MIIKIKTLVLSENFRVRRRSRNGFVMHVCSKVFVLKFKDNYCKLLFSLWLIGELVVCPYSGVRHPSTFSKISSSKTTWPI